MSELSPVYFGGAIASTLLYGVALGQACRYYQAFPKDGLGLKTVVATCILLETLTQFMLTHALWFFFILKCEGLPLPLCTVWSYMFSNVPSGLVVAIVQCFYIQSLWCLGQKIFACILAVGSIFEFMVGIVYLIVAYTNPSLDVAKGSALVHEVLVYAAIAASILTDAGITIMMCRALLQGRQDSLGKSRSVITVIITWTLATGVLFTLSALVYTIIVITLPTSSIPNGFYFAAAKLYVNSMLASLNNRENLRDKLYSDGVSVYWKSGERPP
ncbi:hypothetical protein OE88DRAFT_1735384 [Heliocybe sulcata]|uniref:DUF6534 domain-containing protein n=1 Tax=Heliocybe sulcata TaxID=5364 RepID=A0A5C3N179_9AGAM|nr:hypothetical protein OE88DRAFT_1735384 [Heliocybe sulcata]